MKVTKKNARLFVKGQLSTNKSWQLKALQRIYAENQTSEEQLRMDTVEDNGIGFTGCDGHILSSFAKQIEKGRQLSVKQMAIVEKKMPKYWKQVSSFIGEEKLNELVSKHEVS